MATIDSDAIARSIWRSGYVKDKNKVRQEAKEKMRHLIAVDISSELKKDNPQFDTVKFLKDCGFFVLR